MPNESIVGTVGCTGEFELHVLPALDTRLDFGGALSPLRGDEWIALPGLKEWFGQSERLAGGVSVGLMRWEWLATWG